MVGDGHYDLAFSTPAKYVENAVDGVGLFSGKSYPDLRAIGTFPQTDSLILAVDASLGLKSFEDIRTKRPALRIATQPNDGDSFIGFAVHEILKEAGIPVETLAEWGGGMVEFDPPDQCVQALRDGVANAVFYEAVMTPYWRNLARDIPLHFIPYGPEVLAKLKQKYKWTTNILPGDALNGMTSDLEVLDWSDWLCMVRPEFPDDVAYALAWIACNKQEIIERQYRHLPRRFSPLTYPIEPARVAQSPIKLHPGAARYYREIGLIS